MKIFFTRRAIYLGLLLGAFSSLHAQSSFRLVATDFSGSDGYGGVYNLLPDGTKAAPLKVFLGNANGARPSSPPIQGADGYLYGTNSEGGIKSNGTIYKVKTDGSGLTVLHSFGGTDGRAPFGGLLLANNGYLYGATYNGGAGPVGSDGNGVIYKIATDGTGFTKLYEFGSATGGSNPNGGLIQAADGDLYGITTYGGSSGNGTIFKIKLDGSGYTQLFEFTTVGANPTGNLFQAADGMLYGTTVLGQSNIGILYQINTNGSGFTKLTDLVGASSPIQGSDGKLYGTSKGGGANGVGSIYKLNSDGSGYANIFDFSSTLGSAPCGSLAFTAGGDLFGICASGSTNSQGTAFTVSTNGSNYTKVLDLQGYGLKRTQGVIGFVKGSDGNFYCTSNDGGTSSNGELFQLTLAGSLTKLADYPQESVNPQGALIKASNGDYYGTSLLGGVYGGGTIFKISPLGSVFTKLFDFDITNSGRSPAANLFQASNGDLYGTTVFGGAQNKGIIFKIKLNGTGFTKLHDFGPAPNGSLASGSFIQLSTGELVGVCSGGDVNDYGMIYKINSDGSAFSSIYDFDGTSGSSPVDIIQGLDGNLYGTCGDGGANNSGTIFKVSTTGTGFTSLFDFDVTSGTGPYSRLLQLSNGTIFGMTAFDGANGGGALFKINPNGTGFVNLHDFNSDESPQGGGLTISPTGNLYAMTPKRIFNIGNDGSNYTEVFDWSTISVTPSTNQLAIVPLIDQTISFALSDISIGDPPVQLSATASSNLPVVFSSSQSTILSISGTTATGLTVGRVTVTAAQDGDLIYGPAAATQSICVNPAKPIVTVSGTAAAPIYTSSYSTGNQWYLNGVAISSATNVSYNPTTAGTYTVKTTQATCTSAASNGLTIPPPASQTISFTTLSDITLGDPAFQLVASASSTLPVAFSSSAPTVLSVSGSTATGLLVGRATIQANQTGNLLYAPASSSQSICVNPVKPTIAVSGTAAVPIYTSSAGSGNQWYLNGTAITGAVNITYNPTTAGTYTVKTTQATCTSVAADALTIPPPASQTISFTTLSDITLGDPAFQLVASASSTLPVAFLSSAPNVLTISGSTATGVSVGKVTIQANQAGNLLFTPASTSQSICVNPVKPTITVSGTVVAPIFTSSAISGNQWYLNGTAIAGATGVTFNPTASGTYSVKTTQATCTSNASADQVLVITGDIVEVSTENEIKIYPNPAKNEVYIELKAFEAGVAVEIEIFDLSGKRIQGKTGVGGSTVQVDISQYHPATYVLKAVQKEKKRSVKFIKE